jgi:carboxymethylenebutenolidase
MAAAGGSHYVAGQVHSPERIVTKDVAFASEGAEINAYLARPVESGTYPGLIVIHEAFGVNDHIKDICRRFANVGFIALAPNLFKRVGEPPVGDMAAIGKLMQAMPDRLVVHDLENAADYLRKTEGCSGKVGCVGFCMGGRCTLLFACSSTRVDAAVDCWGGFIASASADTATTANRPTPVVDLVKDLHCPLYSVFGAEDQNPSPEHQSQLRARLEAAGKDKIATLESFAGAGHAFFADYRPSYRETPAFSLWPKMVFFLKRHLV